MISKSKKGFTLMEIIAVISLILVVSSIAIPVYSKVVDKQKLKTDLATASQLMQTARTYYIEKKGKVTDFSGIDSYITDIYGETPKSKYNGQNFSVNISSDGKVNISAGSEKFVVDNILNESLGQ